jgi:hypothetical protein
MLYNLAHFNKMSIHVLDYYKKTLPAHHLIFKYVSLIVFLKLKLDNINA